MFVHTPSLPLLQMKVEERNGKRFYVTPEGNKYPSVTTILGAGDKPWLTEWRNRLGTEKAARETKRATDRGTAVHTIIERYLNNENNPTRDQKTDHISEFNSLRIRLNNINHIIAQEVPLYSDLLKIGGRVDCVAEYEGVLSIVDFKTSSGTKTIDMVQDYFLQTTAYALMIHERYDIWIDDIAILISIEKGAGLPMVFREKTEKFIRPLVKRINTYHKGEL